MFSLSVGPFFEEGGGGLENFGQAEILGIFSIEVAPKYVISVNYNLALICPLFC